jgi:hypothetical protein
MKKLFFAALLAVVATPAFADHYEDCRRLAIERGEPITPTTNSGYRSFIHNCLNSGQFKSSFDPLKAYPSHRKDMGGGVTVKIAGPRNNGIWKCTYSTVDKREYCF